MVPIEAVDGPIFMSPIDSAFADVAFGGVAFGVVLFGVDFSSVDVFTGACAFGAVPAKDSS